MIPYASRTGTRRNLARLRNAGWHLLVQATGVHDAHGFPYAIDNGAWTAHQSNIPFQEEPFLRLVKKMGDRAEWIVVPDIVGAGLESLRFSERWLSRLSWPAPVLLAVQDGVQPADVTSIVGSDLGLFVGGSTEWKERTLMQWGELAEERSTYLHVGRVNTARRIRLCGDAGVDSFDGTSASRYARTLPLLDNEVRQLRLWQR